MVSSAALRQAEFPEGCALPSLTCQAVVGECKVLDTGEPSLPLWQLSLHRRHSQPVFSLLQHTCIAQDVKEQKRTVRLLEDKSK